MLKRLGLLAVVVASCDARGTGPLHDLASSQLNDFATTADDLSAGDMAEVPTCSPACPTLQTCYEGQCFSGSGLSPAPLAPQSCTSMCMQLGKRCAPVCAESIASGKVSYAGLTQYSDDKFGFISETYTTGCDIIPAAAITNASGNNASFYIETCCCG
jgi:hypothetical protein